MYLRSRSFSANSAMATTALSGKVGDEPELVMVMDGVEPEPLDILVARLEPVIDLSFALEGRLAAAHNRDALRTTRIVVHVLRAAVDGSLKSPGGYLWKRLGELLERAAR